MVKNMCFLIKSHKFKSRELGMYISVEVTLKNFSFQIYKTTYISIFFSIIYKYIIFFHHI
jgi:hypothetical protein